MILPPASLLVALLLRTINTAFVDSKDSRNVARWKYTTKTQAVPGQEIKGHSQLLNLSH
jgi:hypothetical protein